jgi:iron complex transport system ATP-binding protein
MSYREHIVLEANNLSIGYNQYALFKNINVMIAKGDVLAVVGRNGSGKSTLLKSLCGLHKPLKGEILINGEEIKTLNASEVALRISVVFSGIRNVISSITAREVIALGRFPHTNLYHQLNQYDEQIIEEIISLLKIENILNTNIYALSDGELQKVFIARALVQNTPIILLDEPTSHLDIFNKAEIFSIIRMLAVEKHKAIIFASHELDYAVHVANKCLLLSQENKFVYGDTNELIDTASFDNFFGTRWNFSQKRFDLLL